MKFFISYLLVFLCFLLPSVVFAQNNEPQKCQAVKPFDANVSIEILPQNSEFKRGMDFFKFPVQVEKDFKRWKNEKAVTVNWIPKKHRTNSRSFYSGLSYAVDTTHYLRSYNKGGTYKCGFFSDIKLQLQFHSRILFADRISDDQCRYETYMEYLKRLSGVNENVVANSYDALKQGEILNLIEYAEGEDFVLYEEKTIENLQLRQEHALHDVIQAYLTATAQEAEDAMNAYDLSEAYITLQNDLGACPKIDHDHQE